MRNHELYMNRCLELALLGSGYVSPNPLVGAVVVYEDKIIGEGWHQKIGSAHAEVNAINDVKDKHLLPLSTLYVNLEPCAHTGKTPPCAQLIIESKIPKVVVAISDPNPLVAGKGIQLLKEAGVEVIFGILEKEATDLNKRFLCGIQKKRPYVILKWAQTQNGFLSPDASQMSKEQFEEERHITGLVVQKLVHKWRTQEDAIMVGTQTAITDNPALNARAWKGRAPVRIVLDRQLRLPSILKILDGTQVTYILNASKNEQQGNNHFIQVDFEANWFLQALEILHKQGIQSIVVEGGSKLLHHILAIQLWDEAQVFYSPKHISTGVPAPRISGQLHDTFDLDGMCLNLYLNQ